MKIPLGGFSRVVEIISVKYIMLKDNSARILIVDDEQDICDVIAKWLNSRGFVCSTATSGEEAVNLMEKNKFDLLITDIMMPGMSGVDLLAFVKSRFPEVAVIMVTGIDDEETAIMTFDLGAWGYIVKPFEFHDVILNVCNVLERRRLFLLRQDHECVLKEKAQEKAEGIRSLEEQLISVLLAALATHNDETKGHVRRIGLYSSLIARYLRWDNEAVERIYLAAQLHDLGKIGIPDQILRKPEKLTPDEFELMKKHTIIGARVLESSNLPLIQMAREIALCHHERWDGSGYPRGLHGTLIPESARIVSIADVYDSLIHERPYRRALSEDRALSVMNAYRETSFDPKIFDYFVTLLPQMRRMREEVKDDERCFVQ
ncbi:MAG: response regulator [Desulfomonile tiedjei]|uniref:Response regulator n=1 Tax=Desulfomonile tiedjei TaxID=2358 RepID=A0A9D6V2S2_9BACT|nr:response regulator [Desulfomonile tiedjei]